MFALIVLILAVITLVAGVLAVEDGVKGWWVWVTASLVLFVTFYNSINL